MILLDGVIRSLKQINLENPVREVLKQMSPPPAAASESADMSHHMLGCSVCLSVCVCVQEIVYVCTSVYVYYMCECASVSLEQLMTHVEKTEEFNTSPKLSDYICADEPDAAHGS